MSEWSDKFIRDYVSTKKIRNLKNEIKKEIKQKEIDKTLTEVLKGKYKRRGY